MLQNPPGLKGVPSPLVASAFGLLLVGAVAGWTLIGATYASDVETICNAERASGVRLGADMAQVSQWTRAHVRTRRGGDLFARLRDEPLAARAEDLEARARELRLAACPTAESYASLDGESRYRSDLQRLCSRLTFPDLADLEPAERTQRLEEWILVEATTARAHALAGPLGQASPGAGQAALLRDAATDADVLTCDVAKALETPPPMFNPRACR